MSTPRACSRKRKYYMGTITHTHILCNNHNSTNKKNKPKYKNNKS